jgi:hypothetical protein
MSTTEPVPIARIVSTQWEMLRLEQDRPACWQWAVFLSTVFHRTRMIDVRRAAAMDQPVTCLRSGREVALFVRTHLKECDELIRDCDRLLRAPEFMAAFGTGDDDSADPSGILNAAVRLMEIYERHLEMAEDCKDCDVPERYGELMDDCTELLITPVRDFGEFMKGVTTRFEEMQDRALAGENDIVLKPVLLRTTTDAQLMWSILDRLNDIA